MLVVLHRYKAKLGFTDTSEQTLVVGNQLNDNHWHVVDIMLKQRNLSINLDSKTTFKQFGGPFTSINLNHKVFFGGVADNIDISHLTLTSRKYYGCFDNLLFNGVDVLYRTKYSKSRFESIGDLCWGECEEVNYVPITFKHPQDYSLLPTYQTESISINFKFRTHIARGLLFAKISKKISVSLCLDDGKLSFKVRITGQPPLIIPKGRDLNNGIWHRVEFTVNKKIIKFKLDKYDEVTHHSLWAHLVGFSVGNATLGGGAEQIMPGFVGCMYDIWINNTNVNYQQLSAEYLYGVVIDKCELDDRCLFTPCKNGGRCTQDSLTFKCDCSNTVYGGALCEESIYQPSCQSYKDLGLNEDSFCLIDPDGDGQMSPFKVLCNMTRYRKNAVTVYKHNLEQKNIPVLRGEKVEEQNLFLHTLDYGLTLEAFDVFVKKAVKCRQYIQFICKHTFLMRSPRGPADTYWSGRQGWREEYWGGAEPDSGRCACGSGKNKTCGDNHPDIYCNCDVGDDKWREDSGNFDFVFIIF